MWLLPFVACAGKDADSGSAPLDVCGAPSAEILSPSEGAAFPEGERVVFNGDGDGEGQLLYIWGVDGASAGTGRTPDWVASGVGSHVITLQVTDDCDVAQDSVTVLVTAP